MKIELREFNICGVGSHQYLAIYEQNKLIYEIHGLAFDRATKQLVPASFSWGDGQHLLKGVIYPPLEQYPDLSAPGFAGLYKVGQENMTLREEPEKNLEPFLEMVIKILTEINDREVVYNLFGGNINNIAEGNSNSVTKTFCEILDFPHAKLSGRLTWGSEKNLLPKEQFGDLYLPALDSLTEMQFAGNLEMQELD